MIQNLIMMKKFLALLVFILFLLLLWFGWGWYKDTVLCCPDDSSTQVVKFL
jgi:TRAP-type C4-dicarboxylate transport system permease small subunit